MPIPPEIVELIRGYRIVPPQGPAGLEDQFSFDNLPPQQARRVLAASDPLMSDWRPNSQPPAAWLVDAAERHGGTVGGSIGVPFHTVRIDGILVPGRAAAQLVRELADAFPPDGDQPAALDLAVAWTSSSWEGAADCEWKGPGRVLLAGTKAAVTGLWWD